MDTLSSLRLKLFTAGSTRVYAPWHGTVSVPAFSRLYFITDGAFRIIGEDGEETELAAPAVWLVPAGYSFRFRCDDTMEHVYFHLQLLSIDGLDMLSEIPRPLSAEAYPSLDLRTALCFKDITESMGCLAVLYSTLAKLLRENRITLHSRRYSGQVRHAIEIIHAQLSVQLCVADIAAETHMAPSTLTRTFRRETGMSIGAYIDLLIMQQAQQMLITTDMPISRISEHFGFCDQFYFSRRFKEKFGVPPSSIRTQPRI